VFERGWLGGLFGAQVGPIDAFIPVLAFAIVFGLSLSTKRWLMPVGWHRPLALRASAP
jgi:hypothetical protein